MTLPLAADTTSATRRHDKLGGKGLNCMFAVRLSSDLIALADRD
jgi:hypothetical protein